MTLATIFFAMTGIYRNEPTRIYHSNSLRRLVFRTDSNGCGLVDNKEAVLISKEGLLERKLALKNNQTPLFFTKQDGLITTQRNLYQTSVTDGTTIEYRGDTPYFFSQNDHIFINHGGISYLGDSSGISFPKALPVETGVGVDLFSTRIACICRAYGAAPLIYSWNRTEGQWVQNTKFITPEVDKVGYFSIVPGYNDLVFLSDNIVAFVGGCLQKADPIAQKEWLGGLLDLNKLVEGNLHDESRTILMIVRLTDGLTKGYGYFSREYATEGRNFGTNQLISSSDGAYVYLKLRNNVIRLTTADILARTNFLK